MSTIYPGILGEIAVIAGDAAAEAVARAKGGGPAYFPASPAPGHWLVEAVGLDKARAICMALVSADRGCRLMVPIGPYGTRGQSWRIMRSALQDGCSVAEAARRAGVDIRTARRHKNGHSGLDRPCNDDQGELF